MSHRDDGNGGICIWSCRSCLHLSNWLTGFLVGLILVLQLAAPMNSHTHSTNLEVYLLVGEEGRYLKETDREKRGLWIIAFSSPAYGTNWISGAQDESHHLSRYLLAVLDLACCLVCIRTHSEWCTVSSLFHQSYSLIVEGSLFLTFNLMEGTLKSPWN